MLRKERLQEMREYQVTTQIHAINALLKSNDDDTVNKILTTGKILIGSKERRLLVPSQEFLINSLSSTQLM
tara:strand:+ start:1564 stop:1776 length:213 start_codon:yes stop_codon:yes gene_type:complete